MDALEEIAAREDRRVTAMIDADIKEIEQLFAPDLSWTHASGSTDSRDGFIQKLSSGAARYLSIEREDVSQRQFGAVVLCSGVTTIKLELPDGTRNMKSRYSNLWALREGAWQMVSWQSTAIAA